MSPTPPTPHLAAGLGKSDVFKLMILHQAQREENEKYLQPRNGKKKKQVEVMLTVHNMRESF